MSLIELSLAGLACGLGLGLLYFGGLWLTLRRLAGSSQPALLAYGGFAVRSLLCLLGFYLIARSGLEGLIASLAGFMLTKLFLVNRLGGIGVS
jgi:F1F0 ATPase subunit 2